MENKCSLYRHFGENDSLLYVGISANVIERTYQHNLTKKWHSQIRRIEVEHFYTDALRAWFVSTPDACLANCPAYLVRPSSKEILARGLRD